MTDWLLEAGIGESRWARIHAGAIVEARIVPDRLVEAGTRLTARLVDQGRQGRNAVARDSQGRDYLMPRAPIGVAQGGSIEIEVTRSRIPGSEIWKRPLARLAGAEATSEDSCDWPTVLPGADPLGDAGWDDLIEEARSGAIAFEGGSLTLFATPAMTLVDVDGWLDPAALALAGARAAARAILRLDIGGSIGIDLPTAPDKAARQAAAAAIDAILPQPFERTAVNGFGFIQIVRPRRRASLIELAADRPAFEARALLRRASSQTGAIRLAVHPALASLIGGHPDWLDALARRVGGNVTLRSDPSLPIHGGYAEKA